MKMYNSDLTTTNFQNDGITRGFVIGYTQGCYSGSFDNRVVDGSYYDDDCFAEKITTMETAEVANIGNSRFGWGGSGNTNGASQYFDRQFYDAIFGEDITLIGDANADSKEDNVAYISSLQGAIRWCFYELNLFGDPTMDIWTAIPTDIIATYPAAVPMGSSQITFQTNAPFARIGVLQNGEIIGRAIADASGLAIVDLFDPIVSTDILSISIIAHNKNRHEGNIVITSDVAYVIFDSYEINDEAGNNNGLLDFGEDILLSLGAYNVGVQIATNVNITLISDDEYITITDNTEYYGDFEIGETIFIEDAFAFEIATDVPDQHIVTFEVEIIGQETWISYLSITINAPMLAIGGLWIDDSAGGNNDGLLDPGETADIIIESSNFGNCTCENTLGTITTGNTYITVTSGTYDLGQLAAGETKQAVYTITVDNTAPIGTPFDLVNIVTSGEYSAQHIFNLFVGQIFEDFETGDFTNMGWEFGGNASWVISTQNPYEGAYCAKSGNISNDQTSVLFITMDVPADGEISFFRKVSSESGFDYLRFYIDGSQLHQWSGEQDWNEYTFPVAEGTHTFKWEYYKDVAVSNGSDCGWIDYIIFPDASVQGNPLSVTASASPSEICNGESSQLNAFAAGGTGNFEYQWTPTTGLNNPEIQNPVATPTETTTYTVTVDDGSSSISDNVTITVNPTPDTPVITEDDDHLISSASEGNQWYDSDGPITGATGQTYYPTATDDYYVIVTNSFECVSEPSNVIYFVFTGIKEFLGSSDIRIFPNPTTGICSVEFYGNYGMSEIRVMNIMNEVVFVSLTEIITGKFLNVDLNNISKGVYFLKIKTAEKEIIRKIIVQ
jgi:VCBS repeat-containing protein